MRWAGPSLAASDLEPPYSINCDRRKRRDIGVAHGMQMAGGPWSAQQQSPNPTLGLTASIAPKETHQGVQHLRHPVTRHRRNLQNIRLQALGKSPRPLP